MATDLDQARRARLLLLRAAARYDERAPMDSTTRSTDARADASASASPPRATSGSDRVQAPAAGFIEPATERRCPVSLEQSRATAVCLARDPAFASSSAASSGRPRRTEVDELRARHRDCRTPSNARPLERATGPTPSAQPPRSRSPECSAARLIELRSAGSECVARRVIICSAFSAGAARR